MYSFCFLFFVFLAFLRPRLPSSETEEEEESEGKANVEEEDEMENAERLVHAIELLDMEDDRPEDDPVDVDADEDDDEDDDKDVEEEEAQEKERDMVSSTQIQMSLLPLLQVPRTPAPAARVYRSLPPPRQFQDDEDREGDEGDDEGGEDDAEDNGRAGRLLDWSRLDGEDDCGEEEEETVVRNAPLAPASFAHFADADAEDGWVSEEKMDVDSSRRDRHLEEADDAMTGVDFSFFPLQPAAGSTPTKQRKFQKRIRAGANLRKGANAKTHKVQRRRHRYRADDDDDEEDDEDDEDGDVVMGSSPPPSPLPPDQDEPMAVENDDDPTDDDRTDDDDDLVTTPLLQENNLRFNRQLGLICCMPCEAGLPLNSLVTHLQLDYCKARLKLQEGAGGDVVAGYSNMGQRQRYGVEHTARLRELSPRERLIFCEDIVRSLIEAGHIEGKDDIRDARSANDWWNLHAEEGPFPYPTNRVTRPRAVKGLRIYKTIQCTAPGKQGQGKCLHITGTPRSHQDHMVAAHREFKEKLVKRANRSGERIDWPCNYDVYSQTLCQDKSWIRYFPVNIDSVPLAPPPPTPANTTTPPKSAAALLRKQKEANMKLLGLLTEQKKDVDTRRILPVFNETGIHKYLLHFHRRKLRRHFRPKRERRGYKRLRRVFVQCYEKGMDTLKTEAHPSIRRLITNCSQCAPIFFFFL